MSKFNPGDKIKRKFPTTWDPFCSVNVVTNKPDDGLIIDESVWYIDKNGLVVWENERLFELVESFNPAATTLAEQIAEAKHRSTSSTPDGMVVKFALTGQGKKYTFAAIWCEETNFWHLTGEWGFKSRYTHEDFVKLLTEASDVQVASGWTVVEEGSK